MGTLSPDDDAEPEGSALEDGGTDDEDAVGVLVAVGAGELQATGSSMVATATTATHLPRMTPSVAGRPPRARHRDVRIV